ncbi:MAG: DNA methylase, partial [Planctomycetes bacterium]|nr:DNA methylase [Planctomycetota bacterium]
EPEEIATLVREDVEKLRLGDVKPTQGDIRCVAYGHAIRLAVWHLRKDWDAAAPVDEKIGKVANWIDGVLGGTSAILGYLESKAAPAAAQQCMILREARENYGTKDRQISF